MTHRPRRATRRDSLTPGCLIAVLLFFGIAFVGMGAFATYEQHRAASFLPVSGVVTESRVEVEVDSDGWSYFPLVTFRYEVEDFVYEAGKLRLVRISLGESDAERRAARYPIGAKVQAFYDPADPGTAVLEIDVHPLTMVFAAIGLLPIGIALWLVRRQRRRRQSVSGPSAS